MCVLAVLYLYKSNIDIVLYIVTLNKCEDVSLGGNNILIIFQFGDELD